MSGLYQNLDVSWTNLTFSWLSELPSETKTKRILQSITDGINVSLYNQDMLCFAEIPVRLITQDITRYANNTHH